MAAPICPLVDKRIDSFLAEMLGFNVADEDALEVSMLKAASLRGLYDQQAAETNSEPLLPMDHPTDEDIIEAAEKLVAFRNGIRTRTRARISSGTRNVARAYDILRRVFNGTTRKNRVRLISNLFSAEVDRLVEGKGVSRQHFIEGFEAGDGHFYGGVSSIIDGVYNILLAERASYYDQMVNYEDSFEEAQRQGLLNYSGAPEDADAYLEMVKHRYEEYTKVLECWNELLPFVLKDLVKSEGIKVGKKKQFVAEASSDSYGDNDIAAKWDISEAKRDGWQENSDLQSSFGSVGRQVRRIISTIPLIDAVPLYDDETGKFIGLDYVPVLDDLGNQLFMDPVSVHQSLVEFLKGVKDSDDLIRKMCKEDYPGEARISWMQPIVDMLVSNPVAATQFFVDFKKNFQPYSIMWEDKKESTNWIKSIKTRILNKPLNLLVSKYNITMSPKGKFPLSMRVWKFKPVFYEGNGKNGGEVDWMRLAELRKEALKWVKEEVKEEEGTTIFGELKRYDVNASLLTNTSKNATIKVGNKIERLTYEMKRDFLLEVFTSLGYDVEMDTIDSILNSKDIYEVRSQLEQLFDPNGKSGLLYMLGNETQDFKKLTTTNITDSERQEALNRLHNKHIQFRHLYARSSTIDPVTGKTSTPIKEHSEKLLEIINKHQNGYRVESRVRYQGNTMFSFVAPSYLGDRLDTIASFVEKDDKKGLYEFLKEEYLNSPFFVDSIFISTEGRHGRILNAWLSDMVEACRDDKTSLQDSVAAIFTYERDLGRDDKKFEEFTSKEHGIDMLIHFFADEQQRKGYGGRGANKKLSAMYPVFVLGDAGVSKYIRAPRHTSAVRLDEKGNKIPDEDTKTKVKKIAYEFDDVAENEILSAFWDVYIQERRRMEMDNAIGLELYANGKKVKNSGSEFSILTFLNPGSQEYNEKYAIPAGKEDDETTIKAIIKQYLDDAALNGLEHDNGDRVIHTPSFKQRMIDLGVLETDEYKDDKQNNTNTKKNKKYAPKYKYINSIATSDNIDSKVREFYWNTKLATIQQLQLMTIDPSFYHGTKDLQKRYKEIHAPGSLLDLMARNPWAPENEETGISPLYSQDGIERVVYFKDLSINSEEFNPEFMKVILRTFAQKGKEEEVERAIDGGILSPIPKNDPEYSNLETARQNRIADLLGENYKIYKSYTDNTLTDGQGYRTLSSYRKVMGMAGKWTKDMEEAYQTIMEIRDSHAIWEDGKIVDYEECSADELEYIAQFALVLQPIKPYMFTHEKYRCQIAMRDSKNNIIYSQSGQPVMVGTYKYIPVQHKYAEALIIPELMPKGHKLRDLGFWMDDHNIDMAGTDKIAKVGAFGQADLNSVKDKTDLETRMSAGYVHELPYRDYRIQTNVPEHINASQLFGTQVRKLIMAGIQLQRDGDYYKSYLTGEKGFNGTVNLSTDGTTNKEAPLDGRNLLALYNSLICKNIMDSYEKFDENAKDIEELSNLLQQSTIGSMREAMDNLFAYVVTGDEKFMLPLFEGGLEHDTAALILSTFKKIVNKQQISGGSAVQVSAFGINGYEEDGGLRFVTDPDNKKNILYAEIEMPFDKSVTVDVIDESGKVTKKTINLKYEKYCNPDGTLIPTGKPIAKGTDEWKKYQSYTYKKVGSEWVACSYKDPEAQVLKPLIEEEYPDILSILAYRIPTERDYSMLNCRIKRFTSKMAGGTMKVPPEGTTIAGFDFDIDKLYFMQREYRKHYKGSTRTEKNYSNEKREDIWELFYLENEEVKHALEDAREQAEREGRAKFYIETWIDKRGRHRERTVHETTLNSYWEEANIEEGFGISKNSAFMNTAIEAGISPDLHVEKGETTEWLESYDFSKSPEENTKTARNNLLISLIQARLMDPETVKQRYTPGGFPNASDAALRMRVLQFAPVKEITSVGADGKVYVDNNKIDEYVKKIKDKDDPLQDPEPNYDATDPYTILYYNQQNQVAGKLIGIFANQNTNHAFASLMDEFELANPIEFCGKSLKDLLHKDDPEEAARIDLAMAEFLAASVDAVKDPVLNYLNFNTVTADAAALLARLGYTMREIGLLFSQPAIRKACIEAANKGSNITTEIKNIQDSLKVHVRPNSGNVELTENELAMSILNERVMLEDGKHTQEDFFAENATTQYAALELFKDVLKVSQDVSAFVTNTKFTAANAVSSTFGGMYAQQLRVADYVSKFPKGEKDKGKLSYKVTVANIQDRGGLFSMPIDDNPEFVDMSPEEYLHMVRYNPFAYEQAMFDANRKMIKRLCETSNYYPYERPIYRDARSRLNELALYGTLSEDDINDIHSNIPVALLAKQEESLFNGEAVHMKGDVETNLTNREYYREKFAEDMSDMLSEDPGLQELDIFKYLYPDVKSIDTGEKDPNSGKAIYKDVWTLSIQDVGGLDSEIKEDIRESWAELMAVDEEGNFKNPKRAELGRDLFMYCFYQLGFDFSPISFMHLAPVAVKDCIPVERANNAVENQNWDNMNDPNQVYVWSRADFGREERARNFFGANISIEQELDGNTYQLPEVFDKAAIIKLIKTAKSNPDLIFKIDKDFTHDEYLLFKEAVDEYNETYKPLVKMDVPSNIKFSAGTIRNNPYTEIIPYGRSRTYRQFLDEILTGKEEGLNADEFAQMFILNHLDNKRFVLDTNIQNKRFRDILKEQTNLPGNTIKGDDGKYRPYIVLDVSKYDNQEDSDALQNLVSITTDKKGNIVQSEWAPCIKIGDSYYIASSNSGYFNLNREYSMTYVKVEPWGTSKTITYDGNKELSPMLRYKTNMSAVENRNLNYQEPVKSEVAPSAPTSSNQNGPSEQTSLIGYADPSNLLQLIDNLREKVESNPTRYLDGGRFGVTKRLEDIDWEECKEDIIKLLDDKRVDLKYSSTAFTAISGILSPMWRNITEDERVEIAQALSDYYKESKDAFEKGKPQAFLNNNSSGTQGPVEDGSSEPQNDPSNGTGIPADARDAFENIIIDAYLKAYIKDQRVMAEHAEAVRASMKQEMQSKSDDLILGEIERIRKACKENGIMVLNKDGDPMENC